MTSAGNRTAREVFEDHLREAQEGSIETDLVKNYAADVVILCRRGVYGGHDGLREVNRLLNDELPGARFEYRTKLVEGEVAFLEWAAESEQATVEDGADSFWIRDGRIVAQTIHYTVQRRRAKQGDDGSPRIGDRK